MSQQLLSEAIQWFLLVPDSAGSGGRGGCSGGGGTGRGSGRGGRVSHESELFYLVPHALRENGQIVEGYMSHKLAFGSSSPRDGKTCSRLEVGTQCQLNDSTKYSPKQYEFGYDLSSKPTSKKGTLSTGRRNDTFTIPKDTDLGSSSLGHTLRQDELCWNKPEAAKKYLPFGSHQVRFPKTVTPPGPCIGNYNIDGTEKFLSTCKTPTTSSSAKNPAFGATSPRSMLTATKTQLHPR
eukprot:gene753-4045_t